MHRRGAHRAEWPDIRSRSGPRLQVRRRTRKRAAWPVARHGPYPVRWTRKDGPVVVTLDGSTMAVPADFYDQFFAAVGDVMPDYGGRNLDALVDDLRELSDPLE